jgi:hypothetical protein
MASVIRSVDPADVPFTLVCCECDAGMEIASSDEAVAAGWSEIDYAPRLPMANFLGVCPDCLESFERWPMADDRTE